MYPVMALSPVRMGSTAVVAAAVVAGYGAGRIVGSAWGGPITARRGPGRTAVLGLLAMAMAAAACAASTSLFPFAVSIIAFGIAHAVFHVARQSHLVAVVADSARARALTTLAGTWRISNFIGPVVGAGLIHAHGLRAAYVLAAATIVAGGAALVAAGAWRDGSRHRVTEVARSGHVARDNSRILRTLGVAVGLTAALRAGRIVALSLWADHLGLADGTTSTIFAVAAGVDMLLFYPAGLASDQWGRRWSAVPSTLLLAVGFILIPFTGSALTLAVVAMVIGVGNGWGSGVVMTLGADMAPRHSRSVFIGLWMVLMDVGSLAGPALVALGTLAGLPVGIVGVGLVGLGTSALLHRWIPARRHAKKRAATN